MDAIVKSLSGSWTSLGPKPHDDNMCEACGKRPKYGNFAYCGRTCGRSIPRGHMLCALPECRTLARRNNSYCSELHSQEDAAEQARHTSYSWNVAGAQVHNSSFRNSTSQPYGNSWSGTHGKQSLRELNSNGVTFQIAKDHFENTWRLRDSSARAERIIETAAPRNKYEKYLKNILGQEICAFHSAQCICDFGVKGTALCKIPSCGICNIVRSSFTSFAFGAPSNTGRFGQGIYSYENPALADKFATSCTSSPYRIMIACNVAVAPNGHATSQSSNGSHSQDPVFVTSTEAIVPVFLILYTKRQDT